MEPVPDEPVMMTKDDDKDDQQSIPQSTLITQEFDSLYDNDLRWDYDSISEYFFESARLAYKSDPDYKDLVQAIVVLEANQKQAQKDLTTLSSHRKRAAENPSDYVQKIENKEDWKLPKKRKVGSVPSINWDKYGISRDSNFSKDSINGRSTMEAEEEEEEEISFSIYSNFNKPWTKVEQSRLEDLLVLYPPEEIEAKRWQKIATALGTRTPRQVRTKVQKYFLKLLRAGVPIPGRQPNIKSLSKKSRNSASNQRNKALAQSNNGNEENKSFASATATPADSSDEEISDLEDMNPNLKSTPEYQELLQVRKAMRQKLNSSKAFNLPKVTQNGL